MTRPNEYDGGTSTPGVTFKYLQIGGHEIESNLISIETKHRLNSTCDTAKIVMQYPGSLADGSTPAIGDSIIVMYTINGFDSLDFAGVVYNITNDGKKTIEIQGKGYSEILSRSIADGDPADTTPYALAYHVGKTVCGMYDVSNDTGVTWTTYSAVPSYSGANCLSILKRCMEYGCSDDNQCVFINDIVSPYNSVACSRLRLNKFDTSTTPTITLSFSNGLLAPITRRTIDDSVAYVTALGKSSASGTYNPTAATNKGKKLTRMEYSNNTDLIRVARNYYSLRHLTHTNIKAKVLFKALYGSGSGTAFLLNRRYYITDPLADTSAFACTLVAYTLRWPDMIADVEFDTAFIDYDEYIPDINSRLESVETSVASSGSSSIDHDSTSNKDGGSTLYHHLTTTQYNVLTQNGNASSYHTHGNVGDVIGPASATVTQIATFSNVDGKHISNSLATIDSSGTINIPSSQKYKINGTALAYGDVGAAATTHTHTLSNITDAGTAAAYAVGKNTGLVPLVGDANLGTAKLMVTNSSGYLATLGNGGTGIPTADTILDSILPSQSGYSGKFLTTDGSNNVTWGTPPGGTGDVIAPASATHDGIARYGADRLHLADSSAATISDAGVITCAGLSTDGQITSTVAIGTPPFSVTSTNKVGNLNVEQVDGCDVGITSGAIPKIGTSFVGDRVVCTNSSTKFLEEKAIGSTSGTIAAGDHTHTGYVSAVSSTDHAIVRFNLSAGQVQDSGIIIYDTPAVGNTSAPFGLDSKFSEIVTYLNADKLDGYDAGNGVNQLNKNGAALAASNIVMTDTNKSFITVSEVPIGNLPTGTDSSHVSLGNHTHTGTYEPAIALGTGGYLWRTNAGATDKEWVALASAGSYTFTSPPGFFDQIRAVASDNARAENTALAGTASYTSTRVASIVMNTGVVGSYKIKYQGVGGEMRTVDSIFYIKNAAGTTLATGSAHTAPIATVDSYSETLTTTIPDGGRIEFWCNTHSGETTPGGVQNMYICYDISTAPVASYTATNP